MQPSSFEFVPSSDTDSFLSADPLLNVHDAVPPRILSQRTIDEIVVSSSVSRRPSESADTNIQCQEPPRPHRLYVPTKLQQRSVLAEEFSQFGKTKPLRYYEAKTRLCARTIKRLIKDIQNGKDITKPAKRGRKPKHTPDLLKKIASELCTKNKSLREAEKAIIKENIDAVGTDAQQLPQVSFSTIARYVHDKDIMAQVDIGPLNFLK